MDSELGKLSITREDQDELVWDGSEATDSALNDFCLVGKFLTDKTLDFTAMRNRLVNLWRPGKGIHIKDIPSNRYLFKFFHSVDMRRVLDGGPWTFDNFHLVLHYYKPGDIPATIPLNHFAIWVQVHELPVGCMSERVGIQLGNAIGEFVSYDHVNNSGFWKSYMRIRVRLDVRLPLLRWKKIRKADGGLVIVRFQYERLGVFCYLCGLIGHTDVFCPRLFHEPEQEVKPEWGAWLKAPVRRNAQVVDKWLRDEHGMALGNTVSMFQGASSSVSNQGSTENTTAVNSHQLTLENVAVSVQEDKKRRRQETGKDVDLDLMVVEGSPVLARGIVSSVTVASMILDTMITNPNSFLASPDEQDRQQQ